MSESNGKNFRTGIEADRLAQRETLDAIESCRDDQKSQDYSGYTEKKSTKKIFFGVSIRWGKSSIFGIPLPDIEVKHESESSEEIKDSGNKNRQTKQKNKKSKPVEKFKRVATILVCAILVPAVGLTAYVPVAYYIAKNDSSQLDHLKHQIECAFTPAIITEDGILLPIPRSYLPKKCLNVVSFVATKTPQNIADFFGENILAPMEGPVDGTNGFGNDIYWVADFVFNIIFKQRIVGSSTPTQQFVGVLGETNGKSSTLDKIKNKYVKMRDTANISAHFTIQELNQLSASLLSSVVGVSGSSFGYEIKGVPLVGQFIFKTSVEKLSIAQLCVVGATVKLPFLAGPYTDETLKIATKRWNYLKNRAIDTCAKKTKAIKTPAQRKKVIDEIKGMILPHSELDMYASTNIFVNPVKQAQKLLGNGIGPLVSEAKLKLGEGFYLQESIPTTVGYDNLEFRERIRNALSTISGTDICLVNCKGAASADTLVVLADDEGNVDNLYSSGNPYLLSGPISKSGNTWIKESPHRSIGSIGKVPAAIMIGQRDDLNKLCNKHASGIKNPYPYEDDSGVRNCDHESAFFSSVHSFAYSMNLPIMWGINRVNKQETIELLKELDFDLKPSSQGGLAYQIAFGIAAASPDNLVRMIDAVHKGVSGKAPVGHEATLLSHNNLTDKNEIDLSRYFNTRKKRNRIRRLLVAPMGQTLSKHSEVLRKAGMTNIIGKSGTTETPPPYDDAIRDKYALMAFDYKGKSYRLLILLGSPTPKIPLGKGISGNDLAPITQAVIQHLQQVFSS